MGANNPVAKCGVGSDVGSVGVSEMWLDLSLLRRDGCSAAGVGEGERGCVLDAMCWRGALGGSREGRVSGADARKGGVYEARRRDDGERQSRPDQTAKSCSSPAGAGRIHYKFSHEPPCLEPTRPPRSPTNISISGMFHLIYRTLFSRAAQWRPRRKLSCTTRNDPIIGLGVARQMPDIPVWLGCPQPSMWDRRGMARKWFK